MKVVEVLESVERFNDDYGKIQEILGRRLRTHEIEYLDKNWDGHLTPEAFAKIFNDNSGEFQGMEK